MKDKKLLIVLLIVSIFTSVKADDADMAGAWKGPKDLMINVCIGPENRINVCYCGIFRTFGWGDISSAIEGDSLTFKANDAGSPLHGRFLIESSDRMRGILTMGSPGEEWYFSGQTELIKQKPIMPESLSQDLEGIILPSDYERLAFAREKALDALSTLTPNAYGYAEKAAVESLLNAKTYPILLKDLIGFRRVRSIQIDARDGIFSYPYFNCRFKDVDGKVFFEKTTGSQRKSGYIYRNNARSLVFLGGWSVNDDPQTAYGSVNSVVGTVYKIGPRKIIMIFPSDNDRVEIYEITK